MARPPRHADFFRSWSPEMAYVLGLWWTDGCMRVKNSTGAYEIEIASNDREHLVRVAQLIGGNYHLRKVAEEGKTYKITFCSVEMYRDIECHGGSPRKSRIIGFPTIPAELLPHYVRGVVDGDGTLSWNGDRPILQVYSGAPHFLTAFAAAIDDATGIPAPKPQRNRDNWVIKWSTTRAKCLVAWLYVEHAGLAMERKTELARDLVAWQPRKSPNRGTITERMRENFPAYLGRWRDAGDGASDSNSAKRKYFGDDDDQLTQSQFSLE
jgi:hypothetical protein